MSDLDVEPPASRLPRSAFAVTSAIISAGTPLVAVFLIAFARPRPAGPEEYHFAFAVRSLIFLHKVCAATAIAAMTGVCLGLAAIVRRERRRVLAWMATLGNGAWLLLAAWVIRRSISR